MIEETRKKIQFIPYTSTKGREKDDSPAPTVTINRKYNCIVFSKSTISETGMKGKFIRLFYEPTKKIVGWQIRETISQNEMKTWKMCKPSSVGVWRLQIKKMLAEFNGSLTKESYKSIPVQKYREISPLSEFKDQVFYFVEIINEPDELRKGLGNEKIGELHTI